jgi:hypothetical protein
MHRACAELLARTYLGQNQHDAVAARADGDAGDGGEKAGVLADEFGERETPG